MSTFSDDFERADGGLGNNWTAVSGSASIVSGRASVNGRLRQGSITGTGRQEGICNVYVGALADMAIGPWLKAGSSDQSGYTCQVLTSLSPPTWRIYRVAANGATTTLATFSGSNISTSAYHIIRFLYDGGLLTLWCDGALIGQALDNTWASQTAMGIVSFASATGLEDVTLLGDESVTFSVTPTVVGNYGGSQEMSFAGVGTSWTSGTPGSPTFTVDHGTLSDQEVTSPTSATATYTPGNFLGTATFTDPSTGATDTVTVTSDPTVVPPGGIGNLSEYAVAMLNNTAGESLVEVLTKPNTPLTVDAETELSVETLLGRVALYTGAKVVPTGVPDAGLINLLWLIINGGYDPPAGPYPQPSTPSAKVDLDTIKSALVALVGNPVWDLRTVTDVIGGDPFASNAAIMAAIAALPTGDNQDVLDQLNAMWGLDQPTLTNIADLVQAISTIAGYDLSTVQGWIEDSRGVGLPTTAGVLTEMGNNQTVLEGSLGGIAASIITEAVMTALLDAVVDQLMGTSEKTLTGISAQLDDVLAAINALSGGAPNLWPGLDNVTLGNELALSDGLIIDTPMNGLLFTITAHPSGAGRYGFGTVSSWAHVGAVIFGSDRGDYERSQSIGLDTMIVNAQTMELADSAIIRLNGGYTGTVRTWVRSA